MIVKQLPFKGRYETLIDYILRGSTDKQNDEQDFTIFKNISGGVDRNTVVNSFIQNDKYRGNKIRTRCQHIILSYHYKSNPSPEALWKLTNEFLRLRGMDRCVVFGKCHAEPSSGCLHIHLAVSQNLFLQAKSVRISKKEFIDQNKDLEMYQQKNFPELHDSIVFLKEKNKEQERYQTSEAHTHTNALIELVNQLADTAVNLQHLHQLLDEHPELEPYSRGNTKYYGVVWKNNRKYRLKKLITPERYSSLERLELLREVIERSEQEYDRDQSQTL